MDGEKGNGSSVLFTRGAETERNLSPHLHYICLRRKPTDHASHLFVSNTRSLMCRISFV